MAIAALILADEGGAATSLLPVGGQPLIELQARAARSAGAGHVVVMVEAMPAGFVACLDRLRAEGLTVELARGAADAADRIHPDEQLIVFANGAVVAGEALDEALKRAPVIFALPDAVERSHLERIDATQRWAGLAVVDGALLRATAQMLGDWTLGPTLLRRALQGQVPVAVAQGVSPVATVGEANAATRALLSEPERAGGPVERLLGEPLVRATAPALFSRALPFRLLAALPLAIYALAAAAAFGGWPALGLALIMLATLPTLIAGRLARLSGRRSPWLDWASSAALPTLAICLTAMLWRDDDRGAGWALASWLIVALALQPSRTDRAPWLADAETAALFVLIGVIAGEPLAGVIAALIHAVVSQYWMIRRMA